eukprot:scaffold1006_cov408-Prasinococcus_capsulatus_cf.AAC.30
MSPGRAASACTFRPWNSILASQLLPGRDAMPEARPLSWAHRHATTRAQGHHRAALSTRSPRRWHSAPSWYVSQQASDLLCAAVPQPASSTETGSGAEQVLHRGPPFLAVGGGRGTNRQGGQARAGVRGPPEVQYSTVHVVQAAARRVARSRRAAPCRV